MVRKKLDPTGVKLTSQLEAGSEIQDELWGWCCMMEMITMCQFINVATVGLVFDIIHIGGDIDNLSDLISGSILRLMQKI